ncbi:hypothetical protein [Kitasatospora indigofera]|uniref:hypothetical protein n=1 Tax=Kitasatospora indigofera TaxID=67307 RepID=UPI0036A0F46F
MSLFGTQKVWILGPLTIAGKPLTCLACKDDGNKAKPAKVRRPPGPSPPLP